jgi:hypothetical protein
MKNVDKSELHGLRIGQKQVSKLLLKPNFSFQRKLKKIELLNTQTTAALPNAGCRVKK